MYCSCLHACLFVFMCVSHVPRSFPNWRATRTIFREVASGQLSHSPCHPTFHTNTHTSSLSLPLLFPLTLSHLARCTTTGRADGSPSAHRARKSMWIKGYTQQVWRAASIIAARQRGAPAHLPPRLWDIWLGFCGMMSGLPPTTTTATSARHRAERRSRRLFSFSARKWTNERESVCLLVCVSLNECREGD